MTIFGGYTKFISNAGKRWVNISKIWPIVCVHLHCTHIRKWFFGGHIVHIPPSKWHIEHRKKRNKPISIVLVHNHSFLSYKTACLKAHTFPINARHIHKTFIIFSTLCLHSYNTCIQHRKIKFDVFCGDSLSTFIQAMHTREEY